MQKEAGISSQVNCIQKGFPSPLPVKEPGVYGSTIEGGERNPTVRVWRCLSFPSSPGYAWEFCPEPLPLRQDSSPSRLELCRSSGSSFPP